MKIVVCKNTLHCSLAKSKTDQSATAGFPGICPECSNELIRAYRLNLKQIGIITLATLLLMAMPLIFILIPNKVEYTEHAFILNHPPDTIIIISDDSYIDTIGPFLSNRSDCKFQWQVLTASKGISPAFQSGKDAVIVNRYNLETDQGTISYIMTPIAEGYPNIPLEFNRTIVKKNSTVKTTYLQITSTNTSIVIPEQKHGKDTIWELNIEKSYGAANIESLPRRGTGSINPGLVNVTENIPEAKITYNLYIEKNNARDYVGDHIVVINNTKKNLLLNTMRLSFSGQESIIIPRNTLTFSPVQPDNVSWEINPRESKNISNIENLQKTGTGNIPELVITLMNGNNNGYLVFDVKATKTGYKPFNGKLSIECKGTSPSKSLKLVNHYQLEQSTESGLDFPEGLLKFMPVVPQTVQWTLKTEKSNGIENIMQLPTSGNSIKIQGRPRLALHSDRGRLVYKITAQNSGYKEFETEISIEILRPKLKELKFTGNKTLSFSRQDIPEYTFRLSPQIPTADIRWKLNKSETIGLGNISNLPQEGNGKIPSFTVDFSGNLNQATIVFDFEANPAGYNKVKDKIRYTVTREPEISLTKNLTIINISPTAKTVTIPSQRLVFSPQTISTVRWELNRQESENINAVTGIVNKGVGTSIGEMKLNMENVSGNVVLSYNIRGENPGYKPISSIYRIKLERAPCPDDVSIFNNDAENNLNDIREYISSLIQIDNPSDKEIWIAKAKKSYGKLVVKKIEIIIEGHTDFNTYINKATKIPTIRKQFDVCHRIEKIIIQP